jgi:hypothetical protein
MTDTKHIYWKFISQGLLLNLGKHKEFKLVTFVLGEVKRSWNYAIREKFI